MSSEVVRAMNEDLERGDLQAFVERCHPDAVWEHNPGGGSPEEGVYEGREQIRQLFERIVDGFEYMRTESTEMSEIEGGAYLVRGEVHCKLAASEAVIVEPYEQLLEIRDGLLSKGRMVFGSDYQERTA